MLLDRGVGDLRWKVLWSSGSTGEYCVGKDGWYELSHLTVCEGSGAPLHDTQWEKTNYQLLRAAEAGAMMVGRVAGLLDQAAQVEVGILRDLKGHPYCKWRELADWVLQVLCFAAESNARLSSASASIVLCIPMQARKHFVVH